MTQITGTPRSIRREITALLLLCLSFVLIVSGIVETIHKQNTLIAEQRRDATNRVGLIARTASVLLEKSDRSDLENLLLFSMSEAEVSAIVVKGADGRIISGKRKLQSDDLKVVDILESGDIPVAESSRYDSSSMSKDGKPVGSVEIYITDKLIGEKLKYNLIEQFINVFLPLLIVLIAINIGISRLLLSPLSSIVEMVKQFDDGDFSSRINIKSENEVGALANALNRIADRIENKVTELAAAEKKYRLLFESIQDVFYREGNDGIINLVSPSIEKVLGYSQSDFIGSRMVDVCIIKEFMDVLYSEIARTGYVEDHDLLLRHRDGHTVPVSINAHQYFDENGERSGIECTFRDISERTNSFYEISKLKTSFAEIVETLPSAIIVIDRDMRIELMNRIAEKFCGFMLSQAKGVPLIQILPDFKDELKIIPEIMFRKEQYSREKLTLTRGFENKYYDLRIIPVESYEGSRIVVNFEDVTERVRMQDALIQSEKMLMVGGLAAGTAHEINNPLAAIIQNAQNIERRISMDIPANQQAADEVGVNLADVRAYLEKRGITDFVSSIREGGARASRIIANMLQFSRKSELRKEMSDLNVIVDQSLELAASDYDLRKRYDFKGVRIKKDYASDIPLIPITVQEIEQVILNIVKNAAHAMFESKTESPCITFRTRATEDYAVIDIEDNGPGMTEVVSRRVFEPFFTTKEVGTGTGLGMSVSYTIITSNHNGLIELWSEPGTGTRFTISLPFDKRSA